MTMPPQPSQPSSQRPRARATVGKQGGSEMQRFGSSLRAARKSARLSVDDVAAALSRASSTIEAWERGENLPTILSFKRMVKLFADKDPSFIANELNSEYRGAWEADAASSGERIKPGYSLFEALAELFVDSGSPDFKQISAEAGIEILVVREVMVGARSPSADQLRQIGYALTGNLSSDKRARILADLEGLRLNGLARRVQQTLRGLGGVKFAAEQPSEKRKEARNPRAESAAGALLTSAGHGSRVGATGVFISYRRSDADHFAGRLYDNLVARFGRDKIFMDVDSIELGLDFVEVLERVLHQVRAMVVIIGRGWLTAEDQPGRRRLNDPDDFVRLEIETALDRNIRVIPILVDGTRMPRRTDLPDALAGLARRNGREMSHARFGSDVLELISTLERILTD